jgi:hypothetical protein
MKKEGPSVSAGLNCSREEGRPTALVFVALRTFMWLSPFISPSKFAIPCSTLSCSCSAVSEGQLVSSSQGRAFPKAGH